MKGAPRTQDSTRAWAPKKSMLPQLANKQADRGRKGFTHPGRLVLSRKGQFATLTRGGRERAPNTNTVRFGCQHQNKLTHTAPSSISLQRDQSFAAPPPPNRACHRPGNVEGACRGGVLDKRGGAGVPMTKASVQGTKNGIHWSVRGDQKLFALLACVKRGPSNCERAPLASFAR